MSLHNQPTNPWKNKKKTQKMKIECHSRFVPRTAREPCLTSKKISQMILLCRVHCLILAHANYCVNLVEAECFFRYLELSIYVTIKLLKCVVRLKLEGFHYSVLRLARRHYFYLSVTLTSPAFTFLVAAL